MTRVQLEQHLRALDCTHIRSHGSHHIWRTPGGKNIVVRGGHKDVSDGMLAKAKRLLKAEGLS